MPDETTHLSPLEEVLFQRWAANSGIGDMGNPDSHYDYRGFYKDNGPVKYQWGKDHLPDTYKQHGHPTFSQESKYSAGPKDGGYWLGEQYIPQDNLESTLLQKATSIGPSEKTPDLAGAKRVVAEFPTGAEALKHVRHIFNSKLVTDLNGKLTGWEQPYGRSFALAGPFKTIFMAPDDPNYTETLAHELGHIAQGENGLAIKNDSSADSILNALKDQQIMREKSKAAPYVPPSADLASGQQKLEELLHGWPSPDLTLHDELLPYLGIVKGKR